MSGKSATPNAGQSAASNNPPPTATPPTTPAGGPAGAPAGAVDGDKPAKAGKVVELSRRKYDDGTVVRVLSDDKRVWKEVKTP